MVRGALRAATLLAALAASTAPAHAGSFVKAGFMFDATDKQVDTSASHWIVGVGSDRWLNQFFAIGFEVDFSLDRAGVPGFNERMNTLYVYPYVNAKLRLPTRGFHLYTGGGLGYSPIVTEFGGSAHQIGGLGMQLMGGIQFGGRRGGAGLFVEAQYKSTNVDDSQALVFGGDGNYELFTVFGGISF